MQKRGTGFFNRAVERGRTDVDFVPPFVARLPDLAAGEMPICANGLFEADYDLWQRAIKKVIVKKSEHLFELSGHAAGFNGLFHFAVLSRRFVFRIPQKRFAGLTPAGEKKK